MRNLILFFLVLLCTSFTTFGEYFTATFVTLGNCSICKDRIENAVKNMPGIETVSWKIATDETTVTYATDTTDLYEIMHKIAGVGHDTEWFSAPDSAYNLLIGTCCEYERTINYQNVQIGYLSLMNLWVYPLGQSEKQEDVAIAVFPNPTADFISIRLQDNSGQICNAMIYSLGGECVGASRFTGNEILSLENLPAGTYLLVIYSDGVLTGRKKVIKTQ